MITIASDHPDPYGAHAPELDDAAQHRAHPIGTGPSLTISRPALTRFLNRARAAIGLSGTVDVLLTTDAELKRLNRTFRGKNKPTDVLSFPTPPEISESHAGDLAISLDTAARQAAEHGHTLAAEISILLLHGLLHLAGLDHEADSGEMAARESALRTELRLPNNLIARTSSPSQRQRETPRAGKKLVIMSEAQRSRTARFSTQSAKPTKVATPASVETTVSPAKPKADTRQRPTRGSR